MQHECLLIIAMETSCNLCDAPGRIISLSWHPAGTLIAAGMMDMIRVFDAETGEHKRLCVKLAQWCENRTSKVEFHI